MKTLETMRTELAGALKGFVRVSRTEGLFVSDAPRRESNFALPAGYTYRVSNGLMYITYEFSEYPEELRPFMTEYLKLSGDKREKLLRQQIAVLLRQKNAAAAALLTEMLEN